MLFYAVLQAKIRVNKGVIHAGLVSLVLPQIVFSPPSNFTESFNFLNFILPLNLEKLCIRDRAGDVLSSS